MKSDYMTIRLEPSLKEKVAKMAKAERRRFSDQIVFLMERGLLAREQEALKADYGLENEPSGKPAA